MIFSSKRIPAYQQHVGDKVSNLEELINKGLLVDSDEIIVERQPDGRHQIKLARAPTAAPATGAAVCFEITGVTLSYEISTLDSSLWSSNCEAYPGIAIAGTFAAADPVSGTPGVDLSEIQTQFGTISMSGCTDSGTLSADFLGGCEIECDADAQVFRLFFELQPSQNLLNCGECGPPVYHEEYQVDVPFDEISGTHDVSYDDAKGLRHHWVLTVD